jgi:hypothetical protein
MSSGVVHLGDKKHFFLKKLSNTAISERVIHDSNRYRNHYCSVHKEQMKAEMDDPISELRHNGGSSLLDVVKLQILPTVLELRDNQILIKEKVDRLEGRFEQHVEEHQA